MILSSIYWSKQNYWGVSLSKEKGAGLELILSETEGLQSYLPPNGVRQGFTLQSLMQHYQYIYKLLSNSWIWLLNLPDFNEFSIE